MGFAIVSETNRFTGKRFCKPKVGSSILSSGTTSQGFCDSPPLTASLKQVAPIHLFDGDLRLQKENALKRITIALLLLASPAFATDARFLASLAKLDPETRLEQVCDLEAMNRISHADRAKSDVISHPIHNGNTLTANGGAFRQKGKWYQLSFVCKATPDHLKVISFNHKVGALIPEEKWASYDLWP